MVCEFHVYVHFPDGPKLTLTATGIYFTSTVGKWANKGASVANFQLPDDKGTLFKITGQDKRGHDVQLDPTSATAQSSDPTLVVASIANDPTNGVCLKVEAAGGIGTAQIVVDDKLPDGTGVKGIINIDTVTGTVSQLGLSNVGGFFDSTVNPPTP